MLPTASSRERKGTTMPLGARPNTVSVATPRSTLTPQCEPRWLWIGLRCPLRQQRTSAW